MKAGVIGYPIAHSKSPIIHKYWMNKNNIVGYYQAIEIHPDQLQNKVQEMVDGGYSGFNVTIPHKQNIMALCDEVDKTARAIGAVNTVIIKDKKLYGTNTDAVGFIQNIKSSKPDFNFKNKTALVLGAGGASRAVIFGLLQEGVPKILLANRTAEKAETLVQEFDSKLELLAWEKRETALNNIDIIVNTTSLGMTGKPALGLDLSSLNKGALVCDIVYTPLMTDLLKAGKAQDNQIVAGIGMLLYQAQPAFEAWTGILPTVDGELEKLVLS